ncbi:hypothetical protein BDQ17DRAFT_1361825 [Cyathus striatus]|nr:hypothetical protein BDQ17DRAFT_1361825 [Cyathus striatus]
MLIIGIHYKSARRKAHRYVVSYIDMLSPANITSLEHIQLFVPEVASIAILVFDYALTIELEVKYIWGSTFSITTLMFMFTRYMPFIESVILLYRTFSTGLSIKTCNQMYKANACSSTILILIINLGVLSIRTWAVYRRSRVVGIGLIIFSLAIVVAAIPVTVLYSGSANRILTLEWILLMVYDGGLLALMIVQVIRLTPSAKNRRQSYLKSLFALARKGILYYVYLFVLSALNVIIIQTMPVDFINLLTVMERIIHAVLTCRVILNIKYNLSRTEEKNFAF